MAEVITEDRTFVRDSATHVGDGYTSFRLGQRYPLTFERRDDGTVAIVLNSHPYVSEGTGPMVVEKAKFEKWFQK